MSSMEIFLWEREHKTKKKKMGRHLWKMVLRCKILHNPKSGNESYVYMVKTLENNKEISRIQQAYKRQIP